MPSTHNDVPPRPHLQNPVIGTTIDTEPQTLGLSMPDDDSDKDDTTLGSSFVRKAKKTLSLKRANRRSGSNPSESRSHRRPLSISKSSSNDPKDTSEQSRLAASSSDPFIKDLSPVSSPERHLSNETIDEAGPSYLAKSVPSRPSLVRFRGEASMRAGTQTLIQALQALPWDDDPDNLDVPHQQLTPDSDGEEMPSSMKSLSSSIHAIYRPIARSRRNTPLTTTATGTGDYFRTNALPRITSQSDIEDEPESGASDFEEEFGLPPASLRSTIENTDILRDKIPMQDDSLRPLANRTGSMLTVRRARRSRLANKLKEIFELEDITEVVAEMPCWLLRSVLLQGYMYLTNSHLCFFAHMPSREDQVLKSGTLQKRTTRTKRWVKRWFVLKNDALAWYQSSSDPYFPHGVVDLRYTISCEAVHDKDFRIKTSLRTVQLSADSTTSRDEWIKAIRKVVFKAQNMGESVKIAIPYQIILDVDRSHVMEFSETIEVKVVDKDESYSIDSYFFAYFHDLAAALGQIRSAVQAGRVDNETIGGDKVKDTTTRSKTPSQEYYFSSPERVQSLPMRTPSSKSKASSVSKLTSLLKPSLSPKATDAPLPAPHSISSPEIDYLKDLGSDTREGARQNTAVDIGDKFQTALVASPSKGSSSLASSFDHTYPPTPSPPPEKLTGHDTPSSWSVPVPSWLKSSSLNIFGSASSSSKLQHLEPSSTPRISQVFSSRHAFSVSKLEDHDYDVVHSFPNTIDPEIEAKFRKSFAFDEKEILLGYASGYLLRVLPVAGRFYMSTNYLSFRSSQPLIKTRMMIPIRDVLAVQQCRAFQFSCYGLLVVIKGHEELFFEFGSQERRNLCKSLVEQQVEEYRRLSRNPDKEALTAAERDAMILEELEPADLLNEEEPHPPPEALAESLPAVMFTSTSSTFLSFKPKDSLHFTFLTIGSRGDVQPYIALGKGLIEDGHRVKIATHEEYKEWVESHGMEFGAVGGDPAELMRICVENGMFTVSFLRETLQKFRGWLDELLQSAWDACQGTDVLIESPSAMAGLHIAEALRIPYFRAFTMPWTRTRAYPHAFAVPEHKMGGGYNYMSYVMFDQVFWRAMAGQINRWRRNLLGLASTNLDKMEQHKVPFLYNFSPSVVPPPLDWYEWIRVTGYWFLESADVSSKKWAPPSDLVEFIDKAHRLNKKVVYIGFGSIVVSDPVAMTQCVVEAIVASGVYAILSKGWSDRLHAKKSVEEETSEPLPAQIYQISSIPHDWLFARIDAACHHGGAGTTGASLRAGIPTIIKPFFGDQFFWGDRVEALGVGSSVKKLTVEHLTAALTTATTDIKQIDRAKLLGESIRAENGVQTAIESIYRDLEYARTLIKHAISDDDEVATINDRQGGSERRFSRSHESSNDSKGGAPSDDWSVISDEEGSPSVKRSLSRTRGDKPTKSLLGVHDTLASATQILGKVF